MRLLTLYKNMRENTLLGSQFEAFMEQDLELPPQSTLALINANIKYNDDFILITALNNQFELFVSQAQLDSNSPFIVVLDKGSFNKTTLLENLQKSLNSSLLFEGLNFVTAGLSTNVVYSTDNKLNIVFGKEALGTFDPVLNDAPGYDEMEKVGPPFALERNTGGIERENWGGFALMDDKPINKGAAQAQFQTTTDISNTQFFAIGLVNQKVDYSTVTELPPSSYAVSLSNNANGTYEVFSVDTGSVDTGVAVGTNDDIFMNITEGNVQFLKGNTEIGNPVPYRENLGKTDNYVYMSLFGSETRLNYLKYHDDPFFATNPLDNDLKLTANPNSVLTINFAGVLAGSTLAELLGFDTDQITLQGNQNTFAATDPLNFEIAEDAGVNILIENLPLKSYNFTPGVERSQPILHHIPEGLRDPLGVVSYIPPFIVPVDLNNQFPINLKNMRISIRNLKDNSLVSLDEIGMSIGII
jgi:hypothetical protein